MHQGLLFPDGFEILEQALVALKDIDLRRADEFVRRARASQPRLVNLDVVAAACDYLRHHLPDNPDPDACAAALLAVPADVEAARLREEVAHFVDQVLARFLIRGDRDGPFVDRACRMPWARVLLLVGQPVAAHHRLRDLVGTSRRADLWGAFGDAALLADRPHEANAAFVRALVIDPRSLDCVRLQHTALKACYQRLRLQHGSLAARDLLLPNAWIDGVLQIQVGNRWIEERESMPDGSELRPLHRFARLLFADRTAGPGSVDITRREEMAALSPDLFAHYVDACRRREERRE